MNRSVMTSTLQNILGPDGAIARRLGETYEPVSFADLVEGTTVSAWADGAIKESYPAQATASAIVLEHGRVP